MARYKSSSFEILQATRDRAAVAAPSLTSVIRGTLLRYYLTCGNPGCRCRRSRSNRHGPYWYVAASYGKGRQRRHLLLAKQVPRARKAIAAYKKLWERLCRVSELNLRILKIQP